MTRFKNIERQIINHPSNRWAKDLGYKPLYRASSTAPIAIIGQAPGIKAQESMVPWNDASGRTLREWLNVGVDEFYDESMVAILPMDFYYPGKGKSGDLPPRKDFASMWHPRLLAMMPQVELTILVGGYAQKYYLGDSFKGNLTKTVLAFEEYLPSYFPIVHPSPLNFRWHKNNPWFKDRIVPRLSQAVSGVISN